MWPQNNFQKQLHLPNKIAFFCERIFTYAFYPTIRRNKMIITQ
jgi:hypothetical protein